MVTPLDNLAMIPDTRLALYLLPQQSLAHQHTDVQYVANIEDRQGLMIRFYSEVSSE